MKRIDIEYGGTHFSVGGREVEDVLDEIAEGMRAGVTWMRVNDGEATRREAFLMITPGVPIAIVPFPDELP